MNLNRPESSLVRLTKKLINMNGQAQTPQETKASPRAARQARRAKRNNARSEALEVTDCSTDEDKSFQRSKVPSVPKKPIQRLAKLMIFLDTYDCDITELEQALGGLMQKDERISNLLETVRELQHSNKEEGLRLHKEASRLEQREDELNTRENSMRNAQQAAEKKIAETKRDKEQFEEAQKTRYEKAIEDEKKKLMKKSEARIQEIETAANLEIKKATERIHKLEADVQTLTGKKAEAQKTLDLYMEHAKTLESELKTLNSRYSLQSTPVQEYEDALEKIRHNIQTIAHSYFGELPPEDLDVDSAYHALRKLDGVFWYIPITASMASGFLRACAAQSVIMKAICCSIWQSFSTAEMDISRETTDIFLLISGALRREDCNKEALWRTLTYQGLDLPSHNSKRKIKKHESVLQEFKAISVTLAQIIPPEKHKSFKQDLEHLVEDCISLWNKAKRDSCWVEFDIEPPRLWSSGWVPETCPGIEPQGNCTHNIDEFSWCLFPRVTFRPVNGEVKIVAGSAIFLDSPAIQEGLTELQCQEEEIAQFRRNFVRQPSISKSQKAS